MGDVFASCDTCDTVWRVQVLPVVDPFSLGACPHCQRTTLHLLPCRDAGIERADQPVLNHLLGTALAFLVLFLMYLVLVFT